MDLIDRKLIYYLDLNARTPISKLAKILRIPKATVSFRIKRLVNNGFIKNFLTLINVSELGMFYFKIFIKFYKTTSKIDEDINNFFRNQDTIPQVLTLQGRYDYLIFLMVRTYTNLTNFLEEFKHKFGDYILEKEIHTVTSIHRFNMKFFYSGKENKEIIYKAYPFYGKVDKTNLKLLGEIEKSCRTPLISLAKKLNLTSQAIRYRIKNLEKNKIILGYNVVIDNEKFDKQWYHLAFTLSDNSVISKMFSFFDSKKLVLFGSTMLGKYDLSIEVLVNDNKELKNALQELKDLFGTYINQLDVFLITDEPKMTWFAKKPR